jgi:hypothetical protein
MIMVGTRRTIAAALFVLAACKDDGAADGGDDAACQGPKCDAVDDPSAEGTSDGTDSGSEGETDGTTGGGGEVEPACYDRRTEAFNPNRLSFTPTALRWSCADIDSTPANERGQEYCEYFAIVTVPPTPAVPDPTPEVLGRNLGPEPEDGQTPVQLQLDAETIAALENSPDSIVGACVFTSWNADIDAPCGTECETGDVLGVPVEPEVFRMKFDPNTNEAAITLLDDCANWLPPEGDVTNPDDPLHDPFLRACELNTEINETQHRKSDNVICGAAVRMAECGCSVEGATVPEALAPSTDLGFRLGGWTGPSELPSGCRYENVVEGAQTIVVCDLTAAEVLQNASELKAWCRESYADDVVVHIAIDPSAVTCTPNPEDAYAEDCPAYPWVLEP